MRRLTLLISVLIAASVPLTLVLLSESRDVRRRAAEGRKAKISIEVQKNNFPVGEQFSTLVNLQSEKSPMGFEISLSFNPDVLELTESKLGSLFSVSGTILPLGPKVSVGKVMFGGLKVALEGNGVGLGSLAEFRFKAKADGASPLTLLSATLVDSGGSSMETELINSQITVGMKDENQDEEEEQNQGDGTADAPEQLQLETPSPASTPTPPPPPETPPQPEPETLEKIVEKQVIIEKVVIEGDNLVVRAKGKKAFFSWPKMQVWAKDKLVDELVIASDSYRDYRFDVSDLAVGTPVDVVFVNDEPFFWIFSDRALFVDYVRVAGLTKLPEEKTVVYDLGKGDAARDGKNTVEGRLTLNDAGSLRFNLEPL